MATMEKDTFDSNIYENTNFMTESGTNTPETNEVNTPYEPVCMEYGKLTQVQDAARDFMPESPQNNEEDTNYEPLRMKNGKLSQVEALATRRGKCAKRRWWIAGTVVTTLLCIGCLVFTGWEAGTSLFRNKSDGLKDVSADNQGTTELPETLQEQMEHRIQLKFEAMQRALDEEKAKFNIIKTKLEEIQNTTKDKITNIENRLQSIHMIQSTTEAKFSLIDEVNIENRKEIERNTADHHVITQVTNTLKGNLTDLHSTLRVRQRSINEKMTKLEGIQNTLEDRIENRLQPRLTQVEKQMTDIQTEQSGAKTNIDAVENRLTELETQLTDFETEMKTIQTEQSATETRCRNIEQNIDEGKVQTENRFAEIENTGIQHKKTTAAFSVYPSPSIHAGVLSLNAGVVVPFDTVTVDSMHRFNTDEYHYTCPTTGTYYFSLCINLGPSGSEVYLEVAGSRIMDVYSHDNDPYYSNYNQACNAVIWKCSEGNNVQVKCRANCHISRPAGRARSILTGFLIYPE